MVKTMWKIYLQVVYFYTMKISVDIQTVEDPIDIVQRSQTHLNDSVYPDVNNFVGGA